MDKTQLTNLIIKPTLREIPSGYTGRAVMAIQMIIAHESKRGHYIAQLHGGPGTGFIQMERPTYITTWRYGASCWNNAFKLGIISHHDFHNQIVPDFDRLLYDLRYNIFMARQRLFMKTEALPYGAMEMSKYLKVHWNSVYGAAHEDSYYKDWLKWK